MTTHDRTLQAADTSWGEAAAAHHEMDRRALWLALQAIEAGDTSNARNILVSALSRGPLQVALKLRNAFKDCEKLRKQRNEARTRVVELEALLSTKEAAE